MGKQGRDKFFDMEDKERQLARRQKAIDTYDRLMDELEKYVPEDVHNMAPKDRVSTYVKLLKYILPPAQAEGKADAAADGAMDLEKRLSVFENVLAVTKGDGMVN